MKKLLFLFLLLNSAFLSKAQNTYFQQVVDYRIDATLDDEKHELDATIEIDYTNNSKDELSFIHFHLWPNAFKNRETAFAKQQLENGSTRFHYAEAKNLGYIDNLDFKANGVSLQWEYDPVHIDIATVYLSKPLKSGETITIKTPFLVKIPNSYSRLGHVKQSYQMTQWYPKPAVYDATGWHTMPY